MADVKTLSKIILVLTFFLITSCVTIFNTKKTGFIVKTERNVKVLSVENNLKTSGAGYVVYRSPKDLIIKIESDSNVSVISVPAKKSIVYWENILNLGVGFLIDDKSVKKYSYPKRIYIEKTDTSFKTVKYPTLKKGTIELVSAYSFVNLFLVKTPTDYYSSGGMFGVEMGLNYCYRDNNYIALNAGAATDRSMAEHLDFNYYWEETSIIFVNVRNHNRFGHFDIGYGFNFSKSKWNLNGGIDSTYETLILEKANSGAGLSLNLKCHFKKRFSLSLLYQPNFLEFNSSPSFNYQHFISIGAGLNLKIRQPRKNY